MKLPKSVYDYAPHYWVVVGVLLAALGFGSDPGPFRYFSITLGLLTFAWGLTVFRRRRAQSRLRDSEASS
jgi:hypothetical protein